MEFFKALFLMVLLAVSPYGIYWFVEAQSDPNMFVAMGMSLVYFVAFIYMTILVGVGLVEESST